MNVLDYAWNTATNIAQRDYDSLRLVLVDNAKFPSLGGDSAGFVLKLPPPKVVEDKFYAIHGLFLDQDPDGWNTVWRLFKASLHHASLHAAYSDFKVYGAWARNKDVEMATFAVSFVEDLKLIAKAKAKWPGVLPDIAFANYISALRTSDPEELDSPGVRFATKLLMNYAGILAQRGRNKEEDREVSATVTRAKSRIELLSKGPPGEGNQQLLAAAQEVYDAVAGYGELTQVPFLPYTESHGSCDIFEGKLLEGKINSVEAFHSAFSAFGMADDPGPSDSVAQADSREILAGIETSAARRRKLAHAYEVWAAPTRLTDIEFPPEDYGAYMRVKSSLAGPIKTVKDQLRLVRNVLDDVTGHESGQQLDTQAAMQVMATQSHRSDVFEQLEVMHKEEAWAILIDASKSVKAISHESRGIATCLAEVAKGIMGGQSSWGMYSFNNTFQIIKDFNEEYNMNCKARIGGLAQRNTTLLPDALRVTYKALMTQGASVRILVVVSDGYPSGYNDIQKKLVETIKEVGKTGILLVGIGVDSGAIKEYFSTNCVLSSPYEMMKSFVKTYFEISYLF